MLRAILIHKNLNGNNQLFSEEHLFVDFENEEIENRLSSGGYSENGYDTTSFVGLGIINNPPKSEQGDSKNSVQQLKAKIAALVYQYDNGPMVGKRLNDYFKYLIEELRQLSAVE